MAISRALLVRSTKVSRLFALRSCGPVSCQSLKWSRATAPLQSSSLKKIQQQQIRWHSQSASKSKLYSYEDVRSVVDSPDQDRILIDVREPHEYKDGFIPSAINIPISSQPDALFLPEDEFEDRFGFMKPPQTKEVVFYCKAGVRSSAAAMMAQQGGYEKVGEYRGSYLDWEKKGGETSK